MREAGIQGIYRRKGRRNLVNAATEEDLVRRAVHGGSAGPAVAQPTSPSTPPPKGSCTAPRSWTPTLDASSAGPSTSARQPIWSSTRWSWPSPAGTRHSKTTILHSDHGTQYTSWLVSGNDSAMLELLGSMGTVGDCYDNAMMESFWGTMQLELLDTRNWATRAELANAIFEWIECWYNPYRRHSSIGMHSPVTFEKPLPALRRRPRDPTPSVSVRTGGTSSTGQFLTTELSRPPCFLRRRRRPERLPDMADRNSLKVLIKP